MAEKVQSIRKAKPKYRLADGTEVPGVTTITRMRANEGLIHWAFKLGKENPDLRSVRDYSDDLADIGKSAHAIIVALLENNQPDLGDFSPRTVEAAEVPVRRYVEWAKGKDIELLFAEREMVSEKHRFGGKPDVVARIDGRVTVLDLKTGKAIYDEMLYQVAAYAELIHEVDILHVDDIRILQIGRTGAEGFTERVLSDWSLEWAWFLAMRGVYQVEKDREYTAKSGGKLAPVVSIDALRARGVITRADPATT